MAWRHLWIRRPFWPITPKCSKTPGLWTKNGNARPPKNWDEMLQIAKDLTKDGVYGIGIPGNQWYT